MLVGCGTFVICFIIMTVLGLLANDTGAEGFILTLGSIAMVVLPIVTYRMYNESRCKKEMDNNYSQLSASIRDNDKTKMLTYNSNMNWLNS